MTEIYQQLFLQTLVVSTLVPTDGERLLDLMLYYGNYSKPLMLAVCTAAGVCGLTINWIIGRIAYRWVSTGPSFAPFENRYGKCHALANKYAYAWVLVGFFNQLEAVATLIAGLLKVRLPALLAAVAVGKGLYFAAFIYIGRPDTWFS